MNFCGLVGAVIGGLIMDYTKLLKEFAVVCLGIADLCLIWFMEVCIAQCDVCDVSVNICVSSGEEELKLLWHMQKL